MHDQAVLLTILGIVAIATTVQTVALVSALLAVRRLEARFDEAERELRALRPRLERFGRVIDHVADWTDSAAEQLPRVAADIEGALGQVRWIARWGALMLVRPLRPLGTVLAVLSGLRRGVDVYRQRGAERIPAVPARASLR